MAVDVENGPILIKQKEFVSRVIHEGAEACLAHAQFILYSLALADVAHLAQKPASALFELGDPDLHGEGGAVLAPVAGLESDCFPGGHAMLQALDGCLVETNVEIASTFTDQLFPAVAQALAGLAVNVENGRIIVKQIEGVDGVIREGAEARLARPQLLLGLSELCGVLQDAGRDLHVTSYFALA